MATVSDVELDALYEFITNELEHEYIGTKKNIQDRLECVILKYYWKGIDKGKEPLFDPNRGIECF